MECGGFILKTFKKACVFIGMVVGAGFASGREVTDYFLVYGQKWKLGIIFSGLLFFLISFAVTDIINRKKIKSYTEYLSVVIGGKTAVFTEWVSGIFFFVMFFAMTAAAGSVAEEIFGLNYWLGVAAMLLICAVVMLNGMGALEILSIILVPVLIAGIALIGRKAGNNCTVLPDRCGSVLLSSIIYVSYNTISAASVIVQSGTSKSRADSAVTGILCGVAMGFMGFVIGKAILSVGSTAINSQLPFSAVAVSLGSLSNTAYTAVFIAAVFTTAVCDGMAAIAFTEEKIHIGRGKAMIFMLTAAVLFSFISFSDFVSKIYPVFGVVGVIQVLNTLIYFFKKN